MNHEEEERPKAQQGNSTYRALTDSVKILGLLDWRYAAVCVAFAVPCGLFSKSWLVGGVLLAVFVGIAWRIGQEDPKLPEVRYATFWDKKVLDPFRRDRSGNGEGV
jgi:hypothetical protein